MIDYDYMRSTAEQTWKKYEHGATNDFSDANSHAIIFRERTPTSRMIEWKDFVNTAKFSSLERTVVVVVVVIR
jgi:hypothetical protein